MDSSSTSGHKRAPSGALEDGSSAKKQQLAPTLPKCPYGNQCYRKNPQHRADYDHSDEAPAEADRSKPHCPFGWQCYRKNPVHRAEMYHAPPPKVKPLAPFPTPFEQPPEYGESVASCLEPKSLREIAMCRIMGSIREKPNWYEKVLDDSLVSKWKAEAQAQADLTDRTWEWMVEELRWQAANRNGPIQPAPIDGVWQADGLIPVELREALIAGVAPLKNLPADKLDWHPGSNGQVLDLVHPSLYCYVIGQTLVTEERFNAQEALGRFGVGEPKPDEAGAANRGAASSSSASRRQVAAAYGRSKQFAWLPAEFSVGEDNSVSIDSYINNLHPVEHAALYPTLAAIFSRFIPMLENVLTHLRSPTPPRIDVDPYGWYEKPEGAPEGDKEEEELDEEDDDYYEKRPLYIPDVNLPFRPPKVRDEHVVKLADRPLQVIVKLASIVLTPEKSEYPGGAWHVEGMQNESIVASAIYYYHNDNISESQLAFRQAVLEPEYEQSDDRGVKAVYGLENEAALNQPLGSVITLGDRCIAFPNVLQHQVQPFRLADPTKPGVRKILVFFLVDPSQQVMSTARVPPQQADWLRAAYLPALLDCTPLIPPLAREVLDYADLGTIERDVAEKQREELMHERKFFVKENTTQLFEREFSLCEH